MMMKVLEGGNGRNEGINSFLQPFPHRENSCFIDQTAGSSGLLFMGKEEYKDLKICHHWAIKGLGHLYILSP